MLPGPLLSVYQQYKADTDFVASWLATTARLCGYPADLLSNPARSKPKPKPNSGRAKGKPRSNGAKRKPTTKTTSSKYIVALADFLPLANHIANSTKPLIQVPDVFSTTISRLIDVRTGFGGRMEEHGVEPDPVKDESHQFFVGVLEAVRDTLRPRMSINAAEAAAGVAEDARTGQPSNRFEFLSVYEPSQAFLDAPPVKQPQTDSKDDVVYEAEPQTSPEDLLFAFVLLMEDLNKMREQIQRLWAHHKDGNGDLAAVAVATNTAVEFAHGLIDEMMPLFTKAEEGTWSLTKQYNALLCMQSGLDPQSALNELMNGRLTNKVYEIAQESCILTYSLLNALPDVVNPNSIPLYKEGTFGVYDPKSDRATKTGQQKLQQDQIVIMEVFTEVMTVIRAISGYPATDEFMRAVKEIEKTLQVPFYGVFAAQVFLDIHHNLRGSIYKTFTLMTDQITIMTNSLRSHLDFHKNVKIDHWPASKDRWISDTVKCMLDIGSDPIYKAKVKAYSRIPGMEADPASQHRLLIYSPVISGLILFRLRAAVHEISIAVINAWGSIAYPAHLYNALQREGLLKPGLQWHDMDIVLTLLGDSNIWVGEGDNHRPGNLKDYFNRFTLQMGLSAAAFADPRKRRGKVNLHSRAGPRGIKEDVSVVSHIFANRYYRNPESGTVDWTTEHVEDILARSAFDIKDNGATIEQIDDPAKLREKRARAAKQQKSAGKAVDKTDGTTRRVPPTELIRALSLTLHAESLEMSFPYLVLHRMSWQLLREIKKKLDPLLIQLYTPAYMEHEYQLPWLIGWIFTAASGIPPATPNDGMRLLRLAAEVFNGFLEHASRTACLAADKMGYGIDFQRDSDSESKSGEEGGGFEITFRSSDFQSESEDEEDSADDLPDLVDAHLQI
ncbi:hypothetical protein V8F06_014518 [Rhypophila decipiens]